MTASGGISRTPFQRFRIWIAVQALWLVLVCALVLWWAQKLVQQGARIAELEAQSGMVGVTEAFQRTERMVRWEAGSFLLLFAAIGGILAWLYWRDAKRTRGLQAFFASLTHELRTPLSSIRLQAEAISETLDSVEPEKTVLLRRLLEDTVRMESQVDRTLELARLEGGGRLYPQPICLRPWLERHLQQQWVTGSIEVDVSRISSEEWILADPSALQVIFRNLFENSVRHSGAEKPSVRVSTEGMRGRAAQGLKVTVLDNGTGGAQEKSAQWGELFSKGARSTGAGVGLYLVRGLMSRMEGRAEFRRSDGFEVALTFRRPHEVNAEERHG